MNDPFVGSLTFMRVYSGQIEAGSSVLNSVKDKRERFGRMLKCTLIQVKILKQHMQVI